MSEPWVQIGATILIASGPFQGLEASVDGIDPSADTVVVKLELFGRPVSLSYPLSSAREHLAPFGDQPTISCCPQAVLRQGNLLTQCPGADATYRTNCWWSATTHGFVQVSRRGSDQRLNISYHDMTWPCREKMHWAVKETALSVSEWSTFARLVERCHFWELAYDDGRRISRKDSRWNWSLEGYQGGRYHAVVRQASEPKSEITACCDYLRALAEQPVAEKDAAADVGRDPGP